MNSDEPFAVLGSDQHEDRALALDTAAQLISSRRRSVLGDQRFLVTIAAGLMTLGMSLIVVAWVGASHSIRTEEQIPYLISGGLAGVALAVVGSVCLLAHWLTVLIRQNRQGQAEILQALREVATALNREESSNGLARSRGADRPVRRTSRR